jgi:hypothetical protein
VRIIVPGRLAAVKAQKIGNAADRDRLSYIDALRGYAILGVIAVHSSQLFPTLEWPVRALADQGARGVQLFLCRQRADADAVMAESR